MANASRRHPRQHPVPFPAVPFPALVTGAAPITIGKVNGVRQMASSIAASGARGCYRASTRSAPSDGDAVQPPDQIISCNDREPNTGSKPSV
jgi:hypothetical protein